VLGTRWNTNQNNMAAFAGLTSNGGIKTWGAIVSGGKLCLSLTEASYARYDDDAFLTYGGCIGDVWPSESGYVQIASTLQAFAALRYDGNVTTWGNPFYGGNSSFVRKENVKEIYSTVRFFAALKTDMTVSVWGELYENNVIASNVSKIVVNQYAMAAIKTDGSVVSWGDYSEMCGDCGHNFNYSPSSSASRVVDIYSTAFAFAAIKEDGSVIAWGGPDSGGDMSAVSSLLTSDVEKIYSSSCAFAALRSDGSVVIWGSVSCNEISLISNASSLISNVKEVYSAGNIMDCILGACGGAFVVLKVDGSAEIVGDVCPPEETLQLSGVVNIYSTSSAFTALKEDGSVVTWGCTTDIYEDYVFFQNVSSLLSSNVITIKTTQGAFAALKTDGSVVTWGTSSFGGNSTSVSKLLRSGVVDISSNFYAFSALKQDGSIVTWGEYNLTSEADIIVPMEDLSDSSPCSKMFGNEQYEALSVTESETCPLITTQCNIYNCLDESSFCVNNNIPSTCSQSTTVYSNGLSCSCCYGYSFVTSASPTFSPTPSPTSTPTPSPISTSSTSGLSNGVIVGISFAILISCCCCSLLVLSIIFNKKPDKKKKHRTINDDNMSGVEITCENPVL